MGVADGAGSLRARSEREDFAPALVSAGASAFAASVSLALVSGVGLHFCLPPHGSWLLGWLVPAPLFVALLRARGPVQAFLLAALAGTAFWALHIHWMLELSAMHALNYSAAALMLGTIFGLVGPLAWLARYAPRGIAWASLAGAWVLAEYVRLHIGFLSTPWGLLAYSQTDLAPVTQLASLAGIWGVSFLAASIGAALALWLEGRPREAWSALALLFISLAWGGLRLAASDADEAPMLRVGIVQGGVYVRGVDEQSSRRVILEGYEALSRRAVDSGAELVVWPASSVPGSIPFDKGLTRRIGRLGTELDVPLLVGAAGQDKSKPSRRERPTANSAFLLDGTGVIVDRYDKIRLLPFNEYVPLTGLLALPEWLVTEFIDARAGTVRTIFDVEGTRFGVLICWENLFPDGFRTTVREGADFMVSITNEAFTSVRGAHEQMLGMNRFRAIENGVTVVRVATTGVSGMIDPLGRIRAKVTDPDGEWSGALGYEVVGVPPASPTPYRLLGDWLIGLCALGAAVGVWRWLAPASLRPFGRR